MFMSVDLNIELTLEIVSLIVVIEAVQAVAVHIYHLYNNLKLPIMKNARYPRVLGILFCF